MLAQTLTENPDLEIESSGQTDNKGNRAILMKRSRLRMEAVRDYLMDSGIDGRRLQGKAYGGSKPIANNEDATERAKNRRVEFKVLKVE